MTTKQKVDCTCPHVYYCLGWDLCKCVCTCEKTVAVEPTLKVDMRKADKINLVDMKE